ncbi:MAG: hypothetical protein ACLTXI_06850 [Collinsella sp.]
MSHWQAAWKAEPSAMGLPAGSTAATSASVISEPSDSASSPASSMGTRASAARLRLGMERRGD